MSTETTASVLNGQLAEPGRVRFGQGKTQSIPLEWAEYMLNQMYSAQADNAKPRSFGDLLQAAAMAAK